MALELNIENQLNLLISPQLFNPYHIVEPETSFHVGYIYGQAVG